MAKYLDGLPREIGIGINLTSDGLSPFAAALELLYAQAEIVRSTLFSGNVSPEDMALGGAAYVAAQTAQNICGQLRQVILADKRYELATEGMDDDEGPGTVKELAEDLTRRGVEFRKETIEKKFKSASGQPYSEDEHWFEYERKANTRPLATLNLVWGQMAEAQAVMAALRDPATCEEWNAGISTEGVLKQAQAALFHNLEDHGNFNVVEFTFHREFVAPVNHAVRALERDAALMEIETLRKKYTDDELRESGKLTAEVEAKFAKLEVLAEWQGNLQYAYEAMNALQHIVQEAIDQNPASLARYMQPSGRSEVDNARRMAWEEPGQLIDLLSQFLQDLRKAALPLLSDNSPEALVLREVLGDKHVTLPKNLDAEWLQEQTAGLKAAIDHALPDFKLPEAGQHRG